VRDEPSWKNVNSDMETRTIDTYSSSTESHQETDKQNNSDSENEDDRVSRAIQLR